MSTTSETETATEIGGPPTIGPSLSVKMSSTIGDERGKIFVGGLSWETSHATLLKYFSRYGEVIDCVVMKNPQTGKSRGFGFVKFRDPSCLETVLSSGPHILDGRQVDPKACNPRHLNKGTGDGRPEGTKHSEQKNKNKIFLGGLPANCTETQIKEVFSQYGKVTDVVIMFDQQKQKARGFGFLSFEADESVERVCQQHYVQIAGKKVECKKAEPRDLASLAGMPGLAFASGLLQANGHPLGLGMAGLPMAGMAGMAGVMQAGGMHPGLSGAGLHQPGMPETSRGPAMASSLLSTARVQKPAGGAGVGAALPACGGAFAGWQSAAGEADPATYMSPVSGATTFYSPSQMATSAALTAGSTYTTPSLAAGSLSAASLQGSLSAGALSGGPLSAGSLPAGSVYSAQGVDAQERVSQAGYVAASPIPQSTTPGSQSTDGAQPEKAGYIVYNNQPLAASSLGLFGNYPHEASSYGPARGYIDGRAAATFQSPYSAGLAYASTPGLAHLQGYGTALSAAGYGGMALPLGYGGQGDASAAFTLAARSALSASTFHPYRRADDGR